MFSLVCCTKQLVALKIVSNWFPSVKQDRNYFNPELKKGNEKYEKCSKKNCPNFNHKSLKIVKIIIKIEERSSKNSSQNPQILSTSLSITCILCHAASLKILAQEFLCTANMIDS